MPFRNSIIGGNGSLVRDAIQSPNFSVSPETGVVGWQIAKDGSATFSDVTIGSTDWVISSDGDASLHTLDVTGVDSNSDGVPDSGFTIYGKDFSSYLDGKARGLVEWRQNFTGTYQACTTSVGLGEISAYTEPGRRYRITFSGPRAYADVANTLILLTLYYKWGTDPISLSSFYSNSSNRVVMTFAGTTYVSCPDLTWTFSGGGWIRIMPVAVRLSGSGNCTLYWDNGDPLEMTLEDLGIVDRGSWQANNGGGSGGPSTVQYVSTWQVTDSASYRADGSTRGDTTDVVQGYYSSNGNQHGKFVFNGGAISGQTGVSLATAMTGLSSLDKLEIYVYANHWYWGTGGTAIIRPWNSTALSNAVPGGSYIASGSWGANAGRWVDITSIASSAIRGFSLGQGLSNDGLYYGRFDGVNGTNKALLRATYTK